MFLQQLGRGLRTSKGKEYLNVLDFIGNYEKAGRAPLLQNSFAISSACCLEQQKPRALLERSDKAVILASVATLGRSEYLTEDFFAPDYFDYVTECLTFLKDIVACFNISSL